LLVCNASELFWAVSFDTFIDWSVLTFLSAPSRYLVVSELLKKSKGSRIVNVSSLVAATVYDLDVTKLNTYPGLDHKLYARSKFCVQLFTIELAKKLRSTNITTYSVHPGIVRTNLFENVYGLGKIIILLGLFFFKVSP
jgi:NAD(P)-dependent dehydrogenase (short-subunit alcohol dehydrogenase family)